MLDIRIKIISSLEFYWVSNNIFSCFPFFISAPNITNVWDIGFGIKKIVGHWWGNIATILN